MGVAMRLLLLERNPFFKNCIKCFVNVMEFLDIVRRSDFFKDKKFRTLGLLRLQIKPILLGLTDRASSYLWTREKSKMSCL